MTSAMKKLGHEFTVKLGFRSRSSSHPDSGAERERLNAKSISIPDHWSSDTSREINGDRGNYAEDSETPCMLKQEKYSRNDRDEELECNVQSSRVKKTMRPMLLRKSNSDLTSYNMNIVVEGNLAVSTTINENSNYERGLQSLNGASRGSSCERDQVSENLESSAPSKVKQRNGSRRIKRSKSFHGWLSGKSKSKQHDEKVVANDNKTKGNIEARAVKRSGSFSGKLKGRIKFLNKNWNDYSDITRNQTKISKTEASSLRPPLYHKANSDIVDYKHLIHFPVDSRRRLSDQTDAGRLNYIPEQITSHSSRPSTNPATYSLDRGFLRREKKNLTRQRSNSFERVHPLGGPRFLDAITNVQRSSSCDARLSFIFQSDTRLNDDGTLETNLCTTEL